MGFPTLKKLTEVFKGNDQITFIAVQTVFEGHRFNTQDKLRYNQLKYNLKIPMAHAAGNSDTHEIPEIMRNYRSGGTPWTVIIDPCGEVVYNGFHIEVAQAVSLLGKLIAKGGGKSNCPFLPASKKNPSPTMEQINQDPKMRPSRISARIARDVT
jgi:hypothetical protein